MTLHRNTRQSKRQLWLDSVKQPGFVIAAGGEIADNADLMPVGNLRIDQITHVAENPADW